MGRDWRPDVAPWGEQRAGLLSCGPSGRLVHAATNCRRPETGGHLEHSPIGLYYAVESLERDDIDWGGSTRAWVWRGLATATVVSGLVGWLLAGEGILDAVYQTIQLFILDFPAEVEGNWLLDLARFGAAGVTGTAIIAVADQYLRSQADRRRIARLSGHTVVIGAGRVGHDLIHGLRHQQPDCQILVVDRAAHVLSSLEPLENVHAIHADAASMETLHRARVEAARRVIVTVGDWGDAAEVARLVASTVDASALTLTHVDDLTLCHVLRRNYLSGDDHTSDVFSMVENAARALLVPFDDRLAGALDGAERIVILGGSCLGEALVVQAAFSWLASARPVPLRISVVGGEANFVPRVTGRWPELAELLADAIETCDESPMQHAMSAPMLDNARYVIDIEDRGHALAVGTTLQQRDREVDCIVVSSTSHLATSSGGPQVRAISSLATQERVLDTDSLWLLARSLHEVYRQGTIAESSPNAESWGRLADDIREDNRHAAEFMLRSLAEHNFGIDRAAELDPSVDPVRLSDAVARARVEALAAEEHARWLKSRSSSSAPPRRYTATWEELEPEARRAGLETVERWPRLLMRLGYVIRDLGHGQDVEQALRAALPYRRVGTVTAWRAASDRAWTTTSGQHMTARAGDWLVQDAETLWSVTDEAFRQSHEHEHEDRYHRRGVVHAVQLRQEMWVTTPEGDARASPGDWLVQNDQGHTWPVPDAHFQQSYELA